MQSNIQDKKKVSLGLPCYNEEKNILKVLNKSITFLKKNFINWEIILIDNNSKDKTLETINLQLKKLSKSLKKKIILKKNKKNIFYSGSVEKIINLSKFNTVCIMDSDNQYEIKDILKLYNYMNYNSYDLVIGYRKSRNDNLIRKCVTKIFNIICNLLIDSNLNDINCGIRILKKLPKKIKLIKGINSSNPELFCIYKKNNKKISEFQVLHYNRLSGESVNDLNSIIKNIYKYIVYLFSIRIKD